ncbi:MAG: sigma-54 dependent transcriptional regulator [Planctomycetota bacterium]
MYIRIVLALEAEVLRRRIQRLIKIPHVLVTSVMDKTLFWDTLDKQCTDIFVLDNGFIDNSYESFMPKLRNLPDHPEVLIVRDHEDPEERANLLAAGCGVVLYDGLSDDSIKAVFQTLINKRREDTIRRFQAERPGFQPCLQDFVSESPEMQKFMEIVYRVVPSDSSLLVLGETGVGKERLGRAIHNEGPRAGMPFIMVNCAALPEALLESEFFGHGEGAFTGALKARRGYFELAHKGTIFLDEICELPFHLQAKLLQVLQDRMIHPVGSEKFVEIDVRVIAATNRDIVKEIAAGRFREDLYYRLSVVTLKIPPLRERREDIPMLLESYLEHFCYRFGRKITGPGHETMKTLSEYSWPGNVRELINLTERAVLLCKGDSIDFADLPESITRREYSVAEEPSKPAIPGCESFLLENEGVKTWDQARADMLDTFEREYFSRLLQMTRGRINESAGYAGISSRSLQEKMKRHGLHKEDFKPFRPLLPQKTQKIDMPDAKKQTRSGTGNP